MKVTKEMFNKLKPLDRMEYRQRFNYINSMPSALFLFMKLCFFLLAFLFLADIWTTMRTGVMFSTTIYLAMFTLIKILFFTGLIFDFMQIIAFHFQKKKLDEEYFGKEKNPKRNKLFSVRIEIKKKKNGASKKNKTK